MKKTLLITGFLLGFMIPFTSWAQLTGTKTIGGSNADYATFTAAVNALTAQGVSGPVTFNVAAGTYNEQIVLGTISGVSATNRITFKSAANDSTQVILAYASSSSTNNNYVVKFNGADYVTFKNMTIERTGSNTYATVIDFQGASHHNYFIGNIIKNGTASTGLYASLIYAFNQNNAVHDDIQVIGNKMVNGGVAIMDFGAGTNSLGTGLVIENNIFQNQGRNAIYLSNQSAPKIKNNTISATTTNSSYSAFLGLGIKSALIFTGNNIAINNGTGIFMQTSNGSSPKGLIANNFISLSGSGYGINFSNVMSQHIYFNSINIVGASSTGFKLTINASGANRFKNNIVKVGSGSVCMNISSVSQAFSALDYNDYYFPGGNLGQIGNSTYSSLSAWKSATAKDQNSMNANPNFISNTNLHINSSTIALQGTSANTTPSVSVDIDGQSRNINTPDIGADEFSVTDFAIDTIILDTTMCIGASYDMTIGIKNEGTATVSGYLPVLYQLGTSSSVQLGIAQIQNLAPGAVFNYHPTTKVLANPLGSHNMKVLIVPQNDADSTNDFAYLNILISNYPVSNLPNDTSACAGSSIVLDPGQGYDSYLWYNGATTSTLTVDSTGIGIGGKWISVTITDNTCSITDSTLVLFKDCTGMEENELSANMKIYPNPASEYIAIDLTADAMLQRVRIISIDGQLVMDKNQGDLHHIQLGDLSKGVYYLRIETNKGSALKKLIIQ